MARPTRNTSVSADTESSTVVSLDLVKGAARKQLAFTSSASPKGEAVVALVEALLAKANEDNLVFTHSSGMELVISIRGGNASLTADDFL